MTGPETQAPAAVGAPNPEDGPAEGEEQSPEEPFDAHATPGGVAAAVEAVLMVVDEPVPLADLAAALELPLAEVEEIVRGLAAGYDRDHRGFALLELAGGWRVYSRGEYAPLVERFLLGGRQARLTQASLETLAVIAYRQPISRARIRAVRGVNVDGVVRTLLARGLVEEVGTEPDGQAMLYGTTSLFLQRMGLRSLDDLPPLAPYLPDADAIDELAERTT